MAEPIASPSIRASAERMRSRRALERALEEIQPKIRVVAEGILAEASPIDLLAVGAEGELIAIRMAEPGDDLATLTRLLSDLSWLRPRRKDLLKLASGNGIDPSAEPRGLLVAPSIARETRAAVDNFPADTLQLWLGRPASEGDRVPMWIEQLEPAPDRSSDVAPPLRTPVPDPACEAPEATRSSVSPEPRASVAHARPSPAQPSFARITADPRDSPRPPSADRPGSPLTAPPSPSAFRTGLSAADLASARRPTGADRLGAEDRTEP